MLKPEPLPADHYTLTFNNLGYEENCTSVAFPGTSDVLTPQQANERPPPPAYDALFNNRVDLIPTPISKNRDPRNLWDKYHEMYENSIFQQLIWLGALVFSIVYIYVGSVYTGKCRTHIYLTHIDNGNKMVSEDDLAFWMKIEGGVFCALVLFVFLSRVLDLINRRRTKRIERSKVDRTSKWEIFSYYMRICLFIACFVMCMIGAERIFGTNVVKIKVVDCDKSFYDFYNSAKKGQIVVFASYAAYAVFAMFYIILFSQKNYMNRKFRFFGYLLDVDQDGVITQHDMRKTYEKLELIRRTIGDRGDPVQEGEQLEVFNKYIFKLGPNKDITVDEYVSYLRGIFAPGDSKEMRPLITALFNAFSTAEYRKKKTILVYEDFARFWDILAGVDPCHCKKIFIQDFSNPTTMASLLEDFVNFLSTDQSFAFYTGSVFFMLKPSYEPDPTFVRICRPSCCNV